MSLVYNAQVSETDVKLASLGPNLTGQAVIFKTTGRDDPRINIALKKCADAGFTVTRIDVPAHHSQVFNHR